MAKLGKKAAVVELSAPSVLTATNVETVAVLKPAHYTIEQVQEALLSVEGVSFKAPRANGNILGKIKGKSFYLDLPDRSSKPEQGITVRFGFKPEGYELQAYKTNTISGNWVECKGELNARNEEEIAYLKEILSNVA